MEIKEYTNSDYAQWDQFLKTNPESSYYHLANWKLCFEKAYGLQTIYLEAVENNEIVGVLPLVVINSRLFSPKAVSLPFCSYAGPVTESNHLRPFNKALGYDGQENKKVQAALINKGKELLLNYFPKIKGLEIRKISPTPNPDLEVGFATMIKLLPKNPDLLWSELPKKRRNDVKRAQTRNFEIKFAQEHLDDFYHVYARNMHQLGTPVHSKQWFKSILEQFSDRVELITIWLKEKPIGGMILFKQKNSISVLYASTLKKYNSLGPNIMLYWEALKYSIENGFENFEFGRSKVGSSTHFFKKKWGAQPYQLNYELIDFQTNDVSDSADNYSSKKTKLISSVWRKIPFHLTLWLGPKLRKYIP